MTDLIGWISSGILVLTVVTQVHRQWSAGSSKGVSIWLFIGQSTASLGFLLYSVRITNWVFVVTNATTALAGAAGMMVVFVHRRRERRSHGQPGASALHDDPFDASHLGRLSAEDARRRTSGPK